MEVQIEGPKPTADFAQQVGALLEEIITVTGQKVSNFKIADARSCIGERRSQGKDFVLVARRGIEDDSWFR